MCWRMNEGIKMQGVPGEDAGEASAPSRRKISGTISKGQAAVLSVQHMMTDKVSAEGLDS